MPTTEQLLQALERRVAALQKTRPEFADALSLQQQLIQATLTSARPPHADPFPLPRDHASARLRQGVPLLHEQAINLDIDYAADLFSRLVSVLQDRNDPEVEPRVNTLIEAATGGNLDPQQLFTEAFVQHADHLFAFAARAGVDADLLSALARQTVAPILQAYAAQLQPMVDRASADGAGWQQGYCPICGAWPVLGELRGVELARYSRCAGCGAGWRALRLGCPYCGNEDYRLLQTLTVEGEQRFRVSVCDRCHGYLKIANAFDPPPSELLALDDVASMHLDVAAIERGYHRPAASGFTIELAVPDQEWTEELD